jgi:hypothetical protein
MHWRGLVVAVVAILLGGAIWLQAAKPGTHTGYDFALYIDAARSVAAGSNPYHRLITLHQDTRAGDTGLAASGYVYPPLLAVVLSLPVRLGLDTRSIALLWEMLTLVAVFWMGYELNLGLRGRRDWSGALAFGTIYLLPSLVMYDLFLGQADSLVTALAVVSCGLWLRRNRWAALPLGIAIAIKPLVAILLLVWLWKGDWRAALRGAIVAALLLLLPFGAIGLEGVRDYATFLTRFNGLSADADVMNQAPYGLLLRALTLNAFTKPLLVAPWLVLPLRLVITGGLAACWLRVVSRARAADQTRALLECLLALPLVVLLSPFAEQIHFCLVIPALIGLSWLALTRHLWHRPAAWVLWGALAVACIPRLEDLIVPNSWVILPGQTDPRIGPLIVLLRTGTFLWIGLATLLAGIRLLAPAVSSDRPESAEEMAEASVATIQP